MLWRIFHDSILRTFGAWTGPEAVVYYRQPAAVPGTWSPGGGEEAVEDRCRKYTFAIPSDRVADLRALIRRAGNSFDQRAMYLEVAGYAEIVDVRPEDGFLEV